MAVTVTDVRALASEYQDNRIKESAAKLICSLRENIIRCRKQISEDEARIREVELQITSGDYIPPQNERILYG